MQTSLQRLTHSLCSGKLGLHLKAGVSVNDCMIKPNDHALEVVTETELSLFRSLALLLREVMAGSVMLPTMDFMADPVSRTGIIFFLAV